MKIRYTIAAIALAACSHAAAQIELGYGGEPEKGWGDANSVVTPYVSFPETYSGIYDGNAITSVSIAVMEEATNVYVYIKNRPDDQKYIYRQKVEKLYPGWNDIALDTPFPVEAGNPIAIGYKASFAKAGGIAVAEKKNSDADYVYYNSQNRWTTTGGSICIKATVDGDRLPTDLLMLFPMKATVADRNIMIEGSLWNAGDNDIESCTLTVKLDGETVDEMKSLEGEALTKGQRETYWLDIKAETYGTHTVTVEATEINGRILESTPVNTVSTTLTMKPSTYIFSRRIVCEEYTGNWCGFCPRGIVGLEMMREKYGEHFIPIAIHGSDPMEIGEGPDSYAEFIDMVSGAPYCKVNRQYGGDPYLDIQSLFELAAHLPLDLAVDATCEWNDDLTALEVTTTYLSGDEQKNPKYNIAYTITESGITGYSQTNYYSGGKNGSLAGWEDKSDPTMDVVYNDVARAIIGGYNGLECRYEPMEAMMPYTHTITIPLPANVKNPANIKVIAQMIDTSSGRIVNAAEAIPDAAGVESVTRSGIRISTLPGAVAVDCAGRPGCTLRVFGVDGSLLLSAPCRDGQTYQLPGGILIVEVSDASGTLDRKKIRL